MNPPKDPPIVKVMRQNALDGEGYFLDHKGLVEVIGIISDLHSYCGTIVAVHERWKGEIEVSRRETARMKQETVTAGHVARNAEDAAKAAQWERMVAFHLLMRLEDAYDMGDISLLRVVMDEIDGVLNARDGMRARKA